MRFLVSGLFISMSLGWAQRSIEDCRGVASPAEHVRILTERPPNFPDASSSRPGAGCESRSYTVKTSTIAGFIRANDLAAPKKAQKAYERAHRELARRNPDHRAAARLFEEAVEAYPTFAKAWDWLGQLRYLSGEQIRAAEAFETAIRSDPTYIAPYLRLAALAAQEKRMHDAIGFAEGALRLDRNSSEGHYYRAAACHALDRKECALESAQAIISRGDDRHFPRVYLITGDAAAGRGDLQAAAKQYARLVELEPGSSAAAAAAAWIAQMQVRGAAK
jgi:tetratricopeptide (TPR) repeat protein